MAKVVIIGNGVAGVTCARHIRKLSNDEIVIISAESDFFYSRTALMYIYMGHLTYEQTKPYEDFFWKKNKIDLVRGFVAKIDTPNKKLFLDNGSEISYDKLVIATGSKPNKFGWKGQDYAGVVGMYSLQDLEQIENFTKQINHAVIVGGGLIGIELTEMLHSRQIPVTFLVRESSYMSNLIPTQEGNLIEKHILNHGIDLKMNTELNEILCDENGRVSGVITNKNEKIDCQFVGLTVGVSPNIDFLKGSEVATNRGVLVNEFFETNVESVYAIGDCAELNFNREGLPNVEQLWYTGKMHGEVLANNICGNRLKYNRGVLFNSAKFFDIEWHTYGFVPYLPPDGVSSLYWQNELGDKCFRINYETESKAVVGMNSLGIRHKHKVWEQWIKQKTSIEAVLVNLKSANFDPEFFTFFEQKILSLYNLQNNTTLKLNKPKTLFSRLYSK